MTAVGDRVMQITLVTPGGGRVLVWNMADAVLLLQVSKALRPSSFDETTTSLVQMVHQACYWAATIQDTTAA